MYVLCIDSCLIRTRAGAALGGEAIILCFVGFAVDFGGVFVAGFGIVDGFAFDGFFVGSFGRRSVSIGTVFVGRFATGRDNFAADCAGAFLIGATGILLAGLFDGVFAVGFGDFDLVTFELTVSFWPVLTPWL